MKAKVNLSLSKISVSEKIEQGRHYVTCITANAITFPTPTPPLASISTAINNLETAYNNAQNGGKTLTAIMHDKEAIVDELLTELGYFVETTAKGVASVILLAGMNVKGKGGSKSVVFKVFAGKHSGELELKAKFLSNHSYIWQQVEDPLPDETTTVNPAHTFVQIGVSHKASFIVTGLTIGKKYWFRYATVGKDGQSPWSDPISKVVSE